MQPVYITVSSSGTSSPWHLANWQSNGLQQFGFAVLSSGIAASSGTIDVCMEDPTNVYPSPNSSLPTAFPILTWGASGNVLTGFSSFSIAAFRLTVNSLSSAGAKIILAAIQSGIG
jgi:hypothetical protein